MTKKTNWIFILAILAGIGSTTYYFFRIYFFFTAQYNFWDGFLASLLLVAEVYMIVHSFGFLVNIFRLNKKPTNYKFAKLNPRHLPSVAVVVVARHEPKNILEQTLITLSSLDYGRKTVYLLDGSVKSEFIEQNRQLCEAYKVVYFHPVGRLDYKASVVNSFLETASEDYVAIFDADQNPLPSFLQETVALAEVNKRIAFVQTPQLYSNLGVSPIAKGAALQQSVFYESICESKGSVNAMFCCGTNVLIRRQAFLEVGGFDEGSVTEDFAVSLSLHAKGYKSIYYNHVRVFGMAPESLPAYFKQQSRWSAGTAGVLRRLVKLALTQPRSLSLDQWWEYFLSSTYYFVGWAFFLLMICPIIYLVFDVPSYFADSKVYVGTFVPYFTMTMLVFYGTMKQRHYGPIDVYNGIIMASLSFPVLMFSTLIGFSSKRLKFKITPKGKSDRLKFWQLLPWLMMIAFNIIALVQGAIRLSGNPYAVTVNSLWCVYHIFILAQIFRLNDAPRLSD